MRIGNNCGFIALGHAFGYAQTRVRAFARAIVRVCSTSRPPVVISTHPQNAAPLQFYKTTEIDITRAPDGSVIRADPRTGYVSHFAGTGEPALVVHGILAGRNRFFATTPPIHNTHEPVERMSDHEFKEMAKTPGEYLKQLKEQHHLDFKGAKSRIHLLSCYSGGQNGTAQGLADELGLEVVGYVDGETEVVQDPLPLLLGKPDAFVGKRVDSKDIRTDPTIYKPRSERAGRS